MTRTRTAGLALLLAALLVAGCGGGGGGEPTVTQTLHDELQAELDAALAELAKEREAKTTAQSEATRLEGELETAAGNVARLTTELATTEASVTDLTGQLATATGNVTRLTGELETATGNVTRLTAEIGSATDSANANGSLHAQLNAAKAEVTRLGTLIGAVTDTGNAAGSLYAQLNAANAEVTRLTTALGTSQTALTTAQTRVSTLETLVGDATNPTATSLRGQIAKLTVDLAAEKAKVTALTSQLSTAQTDLTTAQQQAQQARQEAQEQVQEAQQQVSSLEANQRAENLQKAFGTVPAASLLSDSPVTIESKRGSLTIKSDAGGFSFRTGSVSGGTGIRSTTLGLVSGGASTGKTVVYTDREVTREILKHYSNSRDGTNDQFRVVPTAGDNIGADLITLTSTNVATATSGTAGVLVSHGLRTALGVNDRTYQGVVNNNRFDSNDDGDVNTDDNFRGVAEGRTLTSTKDYFTGSVHGVSGRFLCGTGCQVTATGAYHNNDATGTTPTENKLNTVTMALSRGSTELYFRPNSATGSAGSVSLCSDDVRCTAGADLEYMVFGYWREDPRSAGGSYTFDHFAEVKIENGGSSTIPEDVTGTYRGKAVGAYVEKEIANVDVYRQGEFSAAVTLTATSSTAVTGQVRDFETTPTGGSTAPKTAGSWVVELMASNAVQIPDLAGGGAETDGRWDFKFVPAHANAANDTPPAMVGAFDARIHNSVAIVGAFGAER